MNYHSNFEFLPLEWLIITGIFIIILKDILLFCFVNLNATQQCSSIFQSFGIGIGAIFGAAAGLKLVFDWRERQLIKLKIKNLQSLYSLTRLNIDFRVVDFDPPNGLMYIVDLRTRTRHWIKNQQTFKDIDLWYQHATPIQQVFRNFTEGEAIFTRDDPFG